MQNLCHIFRRCAITKKMFPRTELFRVVRKKDGFVSFDPEYNISGRGIHFCKTPNVVEQFFSPQKKKMITHFLRTEISDIRMNEIKDEVQAFVKNAQ